MRKILYLLFFVAVVASAQNPQTQTAPLYAVNAKYTNGVAPGYYPTAGSGLNLALGPGTANCSGTIETYAGGTLALTASTTNYVYLNTASSCAPAVKTSAFGSTDIPIAVVVTGSSTISSIVDDRTPFSVPAANSMSSTPNIIWDDDCTNDFDCAVLSVPALARLYNTGQVNVLALVNDSSNTLAAPGMHVLTSYYGMGTVPMGAWLGAVPSSNTNGNVSSWNSALVTQFDPGDINTNYSDCVSVYRSALAAARDASVTMISTGMLTCVSALMQSGGDSISALTGEQLIQKKVLSISIMGGYEPSTGSIEFNFAQDAVSAQYVFANWITSNGYPLIRCFGFNNGANSVIAGTPSSWSNANPSAFVGSTTGYTASSWDILAIYQAIGDTTGLYTQSLNGTNAITVTSGGSAGLNVYSSSPSSGHYYMTLSQSTATYESLLNAAISSQGQNGVEVTDINNLSGSIRLVQGTGIGVAISGKTITVSCTACGGSGGGLFAGILSTLPTLSGTGLTTAYNQSGTFSAADSSVGISMSDTNQGGWNMEGVLTAYPTPPFTLTTLISTEPLGVNNVGVGLVIAASTTGKAYYFDATYNSAFQVQLNQANGPTSWDSTIYSPALSGSYVWMQIVDNGTTITFNVSNDGVTFVPIGASITKSSSWLAGNFNFVGVAINPEGAGTSSSLMSWTH